MKDKQKVELVFSEVFPPMHGGSGRWLWEVYSRQDADKYVVVAGSAEGDALFDNKAELNIHRISFDYTSWSDWALFSLGGLIFYTKLFLKLRKIIKQYNVTAIHCGRCIPEGFVAMLFKLFKGIPYYCYIHGEDIENSATSRSMTAMLRPVLKRADLLICNSKNSHRLLLEHWDVQKDKCCIVNPGANTSAFVPAPRCEFTREKLGWTDRFVLVTVSRLEERKGHDMMVKAMADIVKSVPNALYAIIGSGPRIEYLKQLTHELNLHDNIRFMPNVSDEDMVACYQQADIFVLPNRDVGRNIEGFGIVMIEAQACGIPVIGGMSGGTPETLVHGKTGFSVTCSTPDELVEHVVLLAHDNEKREKMGLCARKHAEQFDWEIKGPEVIQNIERLESNK
ncbi:glycosyltransferase family 4 protein [Alteromonas sp. MB-3u-76]|uniref:glycosyltransferase family 4 protein n=1 Tax=Alteromonas sp. MB-3u-76 TaxID=2058133 RepID=UPI000C300577|nr:glycosyltransferase family 4 protein [Alteromonas sp. MB-3u-76]AUC89112.1 glycosyltransferase family 4 protein [Alteromonas sp. MB-3u-76]